MKYSTEPDFWKKLCPDLTITEDRSLAELSDFGQCLSIDSHEWELCKELIHEDAYFVCDEYFSPQLIDRLADCFRKLHGEGIPEVFAFVYDEFWNLLLQMDPLLDDLLDDYLLLPAVWAWHVQHENQSAFKPHRDAILECDVDDDEHLDYLTIWIPLTDLNHRTSSISVFPASLDPDYGEGTKRISVEDLQDIRSLQAKRGSVMCWPPGLAHWGTKQTRFGEPRMSVGYFVQKSDADVLVPPPLDLENPLSLVQRLNIIGQQIIDYSREASEEDLKMAQQLVELT